MTIGRSQPGARRVLAMLALLLLPTACSRGDDVANAGATAVPVAPAQTPADPTEEVSQVPVAADASGIALLDPGEEPRGELRYDLASGEAFTATMRQRQSLAQSMNGQPTSDVQLTLVFDLVSEVTRDGDTYTARSSVRNPRVAEAADPQLAAAMETQLAGLEEVTVVDSFDARGQVLASEVEGLEALGGAPDLLAMIDELQQHSGVGSLTLPAEPVGVGARWTVTEELDLGNGIPVTQTSAYEVLAIDGDIVELAVTGTQEVPPGTTVSAEQNAMGADAEVHAWDAISEATTLLDLGHAFPTAQVRMDGHQEMAVTVDGETFAIVQDISNDTTLTPN